jgi:hypothetical protein
MASYLAIAAVGKAIENLLTNASRDRFSEAHFSVFQASDFTESNKIPKPEGATIYLYRVTVNPSRRNMPVRQDRDNKRYRPSLPVDLHFLITTWAGDADEQYRLMGWVMRVLEDTPILPATLLNELVQEGSVFEDGESVELIFDPLSLQDMSTLWENLKQVKVLPSITYIARGVLIDSLSEITVGEAVQTREFKMVKEVSRKMEKE